MAGEIKPIGDYHLAFEKITQTAYVRADPPAVLLQDAAIGSFEALQGGEPGETVFRSAKSGFDVGGDGADLGPLPKDVAYMVIPLHAPGSPERNRLLVGCDEDCDIRINDTSVSRKHAWIERRGNEYQVTDNDSTVATFVNGTRLVPGKPRQLTPSDQVTFGTVDLIFLDADGFYHFVKTFFRTD